MTRIDDQGFPIPEHSRAVDELAEAIADHVMDTPFVSTTAHRHTCQRTAARNRCPPRDNRAELPNVPRRDESETTLLFQTATKLMAEVIILVMSAMGRNRTLGANVLEWLGSGHSTVVNRVGLSFSAVFWS